MLNLKVNKPRTFNYKYKFYKPENDDERPRIDFHTNSNRRYTRKGSIVRMVLLLVFLIYLFITMQKTVQRMPENANTNSDIIVVEEIIVTD